MDAGTFFEYRHGREAKSLVLRCLANLVACSGAIIGEQTGRVNRAYDAYRKAYVMLEAVGNCIRYDGYMSLPADAEHMVQLAIAAVRELQQHAQGADPGMVVVRSELESVSLTLTQLPQYIRIERERLARLQPRPTLPSDGTSPSGRRGGDGPW